MVVQTHTVASNIEIVHWAAFVCDRIFFSSINIWAFHEFWASLLYSCHFIILNQYSTTQMKNTNSFHNFENLRAKVFAKVYNWKHTGFRIYCLVAYHVQNDTIITDRPYDPSRFVSSQPQFLRDSWNGCGSIHFHVGEKLSHNFLTKNTRKRRESFIIYEYLYENVVSRRSWKFCWSICCRVFSEQIVDICR